MRKELTQIIVHGQSPWRTLDRGPDLNLQPSITTKALEGQQRLHGTIYPMTPTTLALRSQLDCTAFAKPTIAIAFVR